MRLFLNGSEELEKAGRNTLFRWRFYRRAISSREAMILTFFSSVPFIPKNVAISMICLSFTKSFGSEQNFSIVGPKSWQLMPFGMRRPSLHSPLGPQCEHNSQIIIFKSPWLKFGRYSWWLNKWPSQHHRRPIKTATGFATVDTSHV